MTLFDKIIYIYFKDFFYHIYLQCFDTISLFFFFYIRICTLWLSCGLININNVFRQIRPQHNLWCRLLKLGTTYLPLTQYRLPKSSTIYLLSIGYRLQKLDIAYLSPIGCRLSKSGIVLLKPNTAY